MGWIARLLGLAPPPTAPDPAVGAEELPAHDLDACCAAWDCTYERTRDWLPDGTPGDVQITLIRGVERVTGRAQTTQAAAQVAMARAGLLWGAV